MDFTSKPIYVKIGCYGESQQRKYCQNFKESPVQKNQ